eukprot:m.33145 g.33145  ORF g.33145 m.33145 type:complete len:709 (+) comp4980_c0_seq1:303-2429(+)
MADAVREQLEQQIPELHDLVASGIFDDAEIKQIVARRTKFEYALRRRQTRRKDFVRYLEYELNCEKLRLQRKETRRIMKKKSAPSEIGGQKRILFIFQRAVQKFKGDIKLWNDYFDFCERIGAVKVLGRAFAEALRYNPLHADLWVRAAAWEFGGNNNIKSARVLMQRGLRLAPDSKRLWTEYLRLELLYLDKIRKRRALLGLPSRAPAGTGTAGTAGDQGEPAPTATHAEDMSDDEDEDSNESESEDDEVSFRGSGKVELEPLAEERAAEAADDGQDSGVPTGMDAFLEGQVPREVYRAAVAKFPTDICFHVDLIGIMMLFPDTARLVDEAYRELGDTPAAVAARCLRPARALSSNNVNTPTDEVTVSAAAHAVVDMFSEALDQAPSHEEDSMEDSVNDAVGQDNNATGTVRFQLGHALAEFIMNVLNDPWQRALAAALPMVKVVRLCEQLHEHAASTSPLVSQLWCHIASVSPNLTPDDRVRVYETATRTQARRRGASSTATHAALRWIDQIVESQGPEAADDVYRVVLTLVDDDADKMRIHTHGVNVAMVHRDPHAVNASFDRAIQAASAAAWTHRSVSQHMACLVDLVVQRLHWTWAVQGAADARAMYAKVLRESPLPLGWGLLGPVVAFEMQQPTVDVARVRSLLEKAVNTDGQAVADPWLQYLAFEASMGDVSRMGPLHDRAVKTLHDPVAFITKARLQQLR